MESNQETEVKNTGICPVCKNEFKKFRYWQKFDTAKCRRDQWEIENPRIRNIKVGVE